MQFESQIGIHRVGHKALGSCRLAMARSSICQRSGCIHLSAKALTLPGKHGIDQCIMQPEKGKVSLSDAKFDARVWNIRPQTPGEMPDLPDIAATLRIELDSLDRAYVNRSQYRKVEDNYIGHGVAEGIVEPCYLSFHLVNSKTRDTISFDMFHPGAIIPGEYEFANRIDLASDTKYIPARKVPGMVVGGFAVGPDNPESNGQYKEYAITAGTLGIDSI